MKETMKLWNSVCKTDPKHTKRANVGGNKITAICPQYQRMNATEKFGSFGQGWGVVDEKFDTMTFQDGTVLGSYNASFWYTSESNVCKFPITSNIKVAFTTSTGKYKVDDEWMKKASTDALTKGLSMLGFNADIFLGLFDDNKYVNQMNQEFAPKLSKKEYEDFYSKINATTNRDELSDIWSSLSDLAKGDYRLRQLASKKGEDFKGGSK